VLEIHPWGSKLEHIEQPDMIIMDLDPADGVDWETVVAAARTVRERFADLGLASFVKTSGGKGLHVVAPLKPRAEWPEVKAFAKALAQAMVAEDGEAYVATVSKAKRKGKILVDYLRNGRGQTAVAPYSSRARAGAPVSMPIDWDELGPQIGPSYFTIGNALPRLAGLAHDPWADFWKAARPLPGLHKKSAR
jgi:bifunctional non-homologous end joining protein LigD